MNDSNTEYTLKHSGQTAVVSPFGASLRHYSLGDWKAVWSYSGAASKLGGQGDVMIPFPGRVRDGLYPFGGSKHELVKNDKDGPNAIHGFVRAETFETMRVSSHEAAFMYIMKGRTGYPYPLRIEVAYSLGDEGLTTRFSVTNTGQTHAPVGAGFHPYFCGDVGELAEWEVMIPAAQYLEMDGLLPTGRVLPVDESKCDFRSGRQVGEVAYNDCLTGLTRDSKGFATASVKAPALGRRVTVRMDRSFDYVVVYTGDYIAGAGARQAFAIEPMTCGPDAFNRPSWGLRNLEPGASFEGSYTILAEG